MKCPLSLVYFYLIHKVLVVDIDWVTREVLLLCNVNNSICFACTLKLLSNISEDLAFRLCNKICGKKHVDVKNHSELQYSTTVEYCGVMEF